MEVDARVAFDSIVSGAISNEKLMPFLSDHRGKPFQTFRIARATRICKAGNGVADRLACLRRSSLHIRDIPYFVEPPPLMALRRFI